MSSVQCPTAARNGATAAVAMVKRVLVSPRFLVYVASTLLALVTSFRLGKDMQWDTLDYHLYAGFSATHDRFGLDYFAAAPQAYLNPYPYAPFYLLVNSGLSALEVASILALVQSAILWLTYELASAVIPAESTGTRIGLGAAAALLAFGNPVLMEQLGSSFADITTAELVLAGALVLITAAVRMPSVWRMAAAGFLLGAASSLKLTNSLDAISLAIVPLFLPLTWPRRWRCAAVYGLSVGMGFVLVSLPWSLKLWWHFANPLFPFFNGVFRSPQYTTATMADLRFVPTSFAAALWRPFAIAAPVRVLHVEIIAPDLRYAVLIALAGLLLLAPWARRSKGGRAVAREAGGSAEDRALMALGSAFLLDWVIWLTVSGNSRYFIPMACIASVLVVALACKVLGPWPKVLAAVMVAVLVAQLYRVHTGAEFRPPYPWQESRWFNVSIPPSVASQPALYLSVGIQSNAFVVPYLPKGSGFVNLEGDYVLGPDGANGARIRELIKRYSPHLRVLVLDSRVDANRHQGPPRLYNVNDAIEPFGLRVAAGSCAKIIARDAPKLEVATAGGVLPRLPLPAWYVRQLVTCGVVPDTAPHEELASQERTADVALDRLEEACPALLQPRGSQTYLTGTVASGGYFWVRWYSNTDVLAWVHGGRLAIEKLIGERRPQDAGSELAWEKSPLAVVCSRRSDGDFLRIVPSR